MPMSGRPRFVLSEPLLDSSPVIARHAHPLCTRRRPQQRCRTHGPGCTPHGPGPIIDVAPASAARDFLIRCTARSLPPSCVCTTTVRHRYRHGCKRTHVEPSLQGLGGPAAFLMRLMRRNRTCLSRHPLCGDRPRQGRLHRRIARREWRSRSSAPKRTCQPWKRWNRREQQLLSLRAE